MQLELTHNLIPKPKGTITAEAIKRANVIWNKAIKAGIQAVIDSDVIQVETGMAKSTLVPLARAVKMVTVLKSSINPSRSPRKGLTELDGSWNPAGIKSASAGAAAGEDTTSVIYGNKNSLKWEAFFEIPVWHYLQHELGNVPGTGPWLSLDIFVDAAFIVLQKAIDNNEFLPDNISDLFWFQVQSK